MARLHRGPLQILIGDIVTGHLQPGDPLPREADLAEQFEISRGTAREVIRGLEERGLISVKHGRGATVNESDRWDTLDADVLAALLAGPAGTKILADFLESRRVFEIEAAAMAAERADSMDIERLTRSFEAMRDAAARAARNPAVERQYHEADLAFHRALVRATKNSALIGLTGRIHEAMLAVRLPTARPLLRATRTLPEHERIMRAIADGNPAAARRAMRVHLDSVREFLAEYSSSSSASRPGARTRRGGGSARAAARVPGP
jgi:DNA-binding FadR family transcriptional regulator